ATPFDADLAKINTELATKTLVFGTREAQAKGVAQQKAAKDLPTAAAADRAAFYGNSSKGAAFCLLEAVKNKTVKLEDLKKEELPTELRELTLEQKHAYLDKLDKERTALNDKARDRAKKT